MKIIKLFILILLMFIAIPTVLFALAGPPEVTVAPDSTNTYSSYSIIMPIDAFTDIAANNDSVYIRFNDSTTVPLSINASYISINNTSVNVVDVNGQEIVVLSPINVDGDVDSLIIKINSQAQIKTPPNSGDYRLVARTTATFDSEWNTSNIYTIYQSNSKVSAAAVIPNPSVASEAASYSISFNLGSAGALSAGSSSITIAFPTASTISDGGLSGVTVNGTSATASASDDTVVITTPVDIDNDGSVSIKFAIGSGIENPGTGGNYNLSVKTSAETTFISSDSYAISPAGQLSITAIILKPDMVNQSGDFKFEFRTGASGALTANSDTIFAIFPQNTYLPGNMSTLNVSVTSGGFSDNAAEIIISKGDASDADSVMIITPINVGNSSDVTVNLNSSSGYLNPSTAGNYTLSLRTSQDTTPVNSNPYAVSNANTTVSQALVTPTSTNTDAVTSYTVDFNLGSLGRLIPGQSVITLSFDAAYSLQTNAATYYGSSTITVAEGSAVSIPSSNLSINNTEKTIQITIPSSVEPLNGDNIVVFLSSSGTQPITNPSTSQNYNLGVQTGVEPTNINSAAYNLGGTAITINSVTLSNSNVNNNSQYTFNITTQTDLTVDRPLLDYENIDITFPEGTQLPASIATSNLTINGVDAYAVTINETNRTVSASLDLTQNSGTFNVVITAGANIINPVVPSSSFYKVTMYTSGDLAPVTSSAYDIEGDNTSATSVSLTINPSVISATSVVNTIVFTTSSTGKLAGGLAAGSSTITVNFDTATVVPASITASTVQINGSPLQSLNVDSTGAGGVVTLDLPNGVTIDASASAQIVFTSNAGLSNGSTAGTYKVKVKTSSDTVYSSIAGTDGDYTLTSSQSLAINSASANPSTQNSTAAYSINFNVGSAGALSIGDTIWIDFPSNTYLPSVLNANDITVNGTNPTVNPTVSGDTLTILSPVAVSNLAVVSLLMNQAAGIVNPTAVQGYTLQVYTESESGPFTSPTYNITQTSSTISVADVTVSDPGTSSTTSYTVDFSIGSSGRLIAGTSTITIRFGTATTVSTTVANYNNSTISVNGGSSVSIASSISVSSRDVTIIIPASVSINNNDQIKIVLDGSTTDPITNPAAEGSYTLQVRSSIETTYITSNAYSISDVVAVGSVTSTPTSTMVNAFTAYTVGFSTDAISGALAQNSGTITVTFPSNTLTPASMSVSNVQVNSNAAYAVSTNPANRSVTITTPVAITTGSSPSIAFAQAAGLQNPSISGGYTLQVSTSSQPLNGASSTYTLIDASSSVSNIQISVTPEAVSEIGEYEFDFNTGAFGRLLSGTSQIYILFPYDATFTQGAPTASKVRVNSTNAAAVSLIEGASSNPDTLIITVPSSVTVGNNTAVNVLIDQTSGIQNASSGASLTYSLYTSVEKGQVDADHSLPVELSSFSAVSAEGSIRLNWVTESELRNAYWIIDRCEIPEEHAEEVETDPNKIAELGLDFNRIRRINGAGTVSKRTEYLMNDSLVVGGHVYAYRLTDVSYNGVMTRHEVIVQRVKTPDEFSLSQNYPNPFNPQTTIPFRLKTTAEVQIKIYNILGQEIITLVNGQMEAGFYNKIWNGYNNFGQRVSSGVYFYLLTAKTAEGHKLFRQAKKMMLLK